MSHYSVKYKVVRHGTSSVQTKTVSAENSAMASAKVKAEIESSPNVTAVYILDVREC